MLVINKQAATDLAKAMRREAASFGLAVSHAQSLDRVGRALGFRNAQALVASLGSGPVHVSETRIPALAARWFSVAAASSEQVAAFGRAFLNCAARSGSVLAAPPSRALHTMLAPVAIRATIRTDDGMREAVFDAAPWFAQATDDELLELHGIGFRGDYAADAVAWHFHGEPGGEEVTAVLDYDQETARCGFEVAVDGEAAMAWMAVNRPQLHASLAADDVGSAPLPEV